jgi:hypothetical protein
MPNNSIHSAVDPWEKHLMALDDVTRRLDQITGELNRLKVPYAIVGGQAVALWVATVDPAAVRTTKDVDLLVRRQDLPQICAAGLAAQMDYFEALGVGMLLDRTDPNPRHAVHLVWADELIRPGDEVRSPSIEGLQMLGDKTVVPLAALVEMKLTAFRDQDRLHLRDMIDVGLVGRDLVAGLSPLLAERLSQLLSVAGR